MFSEDAMRAFDALIGEINGAGDTQKKTTWMPQAWHRRVAWLRWARALRSYVQDLHTMRLALAIYDEKRTSELEGMAVQWRADADRAKLLRGADCAADLERWLRGRAK